ncbi:hypothetical protein [Ruegeria atlantica]|uniref:Uncharacterized protein n=1 Tax=Ruegeria atlantica TaxID=81569 RepID=A0A0P1E0P0_9RHOB|nr:hypothetical protein [Ruegeria atlantica]CUH41177.1 hypothetical protein RUM4293_00041 [Ruegeria atlantica]
MKQYPAYHVIQIVLYICIEADLKIQSSYVKQSFRLRRVISIGSLELGSMLMSAVGIWQAILHLQRNSAFPPSLRMSVVAMRDNRTLVRLRRRSAKSAKKTFMQVAANGGSEPKAEELRLRSFRRASVA